MYAIVSLPHRVCQLTTRNRLELSTALTDHDGPQLRRVLSQKYYFEYESDIGYLMCYTVAKQS